MGLLGIKSSTKPQNMRDEGKVRFTQPSKKIILYDREKESLKERYKKFSNEKGRYREEKR